MQTKDEDFVEHLFAASTHATVLFFTNRGRVYWKKVWELPQLGRAARGKALVNLLSLQPGEKVQAALGIRDFAAQASNYIVLVTRRGTIKKTELDAYSNPRRAGIIAINLNDDDELIAAKLTTGSSEIILASKNGKAIRFPEDQVRGMGRNATGVRGMDLSDGDELVGMEILSPGATVLTVTENGFGKRTELEEYRKQSRGGVGIINIQTSDRNGRVVGISYVHEDDELMLISQQGKILRMVTKDIRAIGRATQGVRLLGVEEGDQVVSVARLAEREGEENGAEPAPETPSTPDTPPESD
jgi:DNA gyrase subunit A